MILETRFGIGDKVWVIAENDGGALVPEEVTVGLVRAEVIDSPGVSGMEQFSNFTPQKESAEAYMVNETGIGSGRVYRPGNGRSGIWASSEECAAAIAEMEE